MNRRWAAALALLVLVVASAFVIARKAPQRGDPRDAAVAHFLGHSASSGAVWRLQHLRTGDAFYGNVPRSGIFRVNATSMEVETAALDTPDKPSASQIRADAARQLADAFVTAHCSSVRRMVLRGVSGNGLPQYRFTWQAREGEAWLPSYAVVSIDISGFLGQYACIQVPAKIPTLARVTSGAARDAAARLGGPNRTPAGPPELDVVLLDAGAQQLVWSVQLQAAKDAPVTPPEVIWVDAASGDAGVSSTG